MLFDRVKYIITHDGKSEEIQEPEGWQKAKKSWSRSKVYRGISSKVTTALTYHGNAKKILSDLYESNGVNADADLGVWSKDPFTDIFTLEFKGHYDFSTIKFGGVGIEIKLNSNLTELKFRKGSKAKIEYGARERIDGTLSTFEPTFYQTSIHGIKSSLKSVLIMEDHTPNEYRMRFDGGFLTSDTRSGSFPLNLFAPNGGCDPNGHADVGEVTDTSNWTTNPDIEGIEFSFWSQSERDILLNISFTARIELNLYTRRAFTQGVYRFVCDVFDRDGVKIRTERVFHSQRIGDGYRKSYRHTPVNFTTSQNFSIQINKHESVSIRHVFSGRFASQGGHRARLNINTHNTTNTANITMTSNETLEGFENKTAKVYDVLKSLSDVTVNAEFASDYLSEGLFKNLMMSNGFMLRGFFDAEAGFIPMTTTFSDMFLALNVLNPIGIEISDGLIRLEDINYFYQDFIYKDVGSVIDFELTVDPTKLISIVQIGFAKYQKTEDGSDLLEFNATSELSTTLDTAETTKKLISKIRGDSTGINEARRGYFDEADPDADEECEDDKTKSKKTDNDLWFIDVVPQDEVGGGESEADYRAAIWSDHFTSIPDGLANSETYFNYRMTPRNMLDRHLSMIKEGYNNVRNLKMMFTETKGLATLVTHPIGKPTLKEDGNVNMNLYHEKSTGLIANFTTRHKFADIDGFTDGVRNFYGMIRFTYKNTMYSGHIERIDEEDGKSKVTCLIKIISRK